jgi:phosphate:Na+ symporter
MQIVGLLFRVLGGLCIFLYGMKVLSDGIQRAAGDRLQKVLNFMTGNRFIAVFTGMVITALVQSSSATTVMLVSFVNAGLITLRQAVGVIMGANIGTTTTAWIVSLIGFKFDIAALALPAVGIGFLMRLPKWKHREWGDALLGFGFIFIGLEFINSALPNLNPEQLAFIERLSGFGFGSTLIGLGIGTVVTLLVHSSAATITLVIALAYRGAINFEMSAAMILGANIGTTIDAIMAAIGAKTAAKQTALVHVLFNVVGSVITLVLFRPILSVVAMITPGGEITNMLAMFHTVFNVLCTVVFLPFVNQFASLVSFIIRDKGDKVPEHYRLAYSAGTVGDSAELNIVRAEKEIRDMAGIVSDMYDGISAFLGAPAADAAEKEKAAEALTAEMRQKEAYADEMRDELTKFLMECARHQLSEKSEQNVSRLLRIVADLENMTDDCLGVAILLETSVKKDQMFKEKEMAALAPYTSLVGDFLEFVETHLGKKLSHAEAAQAQDMEDRITGAQKKLRKYGRKRIEAGKNVKTELLFIDFVRQLEQLGDTCYSISAALEHLE